MVTKEEVYTHRSLEMGGTVAAQGHTGAHQGCSGGRGRQGKLGQKPFS